MLIWSQKVTDFHVFSWSEEARSHSVTVPQHHLVLNESTTTSGLLLWLLGIIIAFKNLWQLIHLSGCSAQRTGYQIQNTNEKGIVVCDNAALIAVWWITSCVINEHISLIFLCLLFCIHSLGELSIWGISRILLWSSSSSPSSSLIQTRTSSTTRTCLTSLSWWRGNHFMHIKFCCLQLRPGKEKLSYLLKCFYFIFSYNIPTIPSVSSRFKSLLQNRPAAENTCIEISHVKYNIFHVRTSSYSHLSSFAFPITATNPETTVTMSKVTTQSCKTWLKFVVFSYNCS